MQYSIGDFKINPRRGWKHPLTGEQFSRLWLTVGSTPEQRASLGIVETPDPVKPPRPEPTYEQLIERIFQQIDQRTGAAILAGFSLNDNTFSCSEHAQSNAIATELDRVAGRLVFPQPWSTTNGSVVFFKSDEEWQQFYVAMVDHIRTQKIQGQQERAKASVLSVEDLKTWKDSREVLAQESDVR